jgi:hypothetical protein
MPTRVDEATVASTVILPVRMYLGEAVAPAVERQVSRYPEGVTGKGFPSPTTREMAQIGDRRHLLSYRRNHEQLSSAAILR